MVNVKVCGIRRPEDIIASKRADMLGFVVGVPGSHRNLEVDEAKGLMDRTPTHQKRVVVTTETDPGTLAGWARAMEPDIIQVHSDMDAGSLVGVREALPARVGIFGLVTVAGEEGPLLARASAMKGAPVNAVVLDSKGVGGLGGTGRTHDWSLSRRLRDALVPLPVALAGGLTPENVGEAVKAVDPWMVDLSSGLEVDRFKSRERIAALFAALGR